MKRFRYTFWNGMLEDLKGEWVKEKEAKQEVDGMLSQWRALHSEYSDEKIRSLLLTTGLLFSVFFNIFQLLI